MAVRNAGASYNGLDKMSIRLNFDIEGMETVNNLLHYLRRLGAKPGGVNLLAHSRNEDITNADLLQWHAHKKGSNWNYPQRDFISSSTGDLNEIGKKSAQALDAEMQKYINRVQKFTKSVIRHGGTSYRTRTGKIKQLKAPPDTRQMANQWAAKMFRAAMKAYMKQAHDRIMSERSNTGSVPPLADKTKERKGHDAILRETGQILDNLDFGGIGGRNIRVTKE
jgi:hypothetical protein